MKLKLDEDLKLLQDLFEAYTTKSSMVGVVSTLYKEQFKRNDTEEQIEQLDTAARMDPENKHGAW